ncbi:hypothetical protein ACHMW6_18575 [Pseudoduganella sp. UC29_106]|uniref:hypothetical protein n=1 Tax=Pseudoduganella sp. UC29_106 TaxID=3374553 RepID=UPI003757B456
MAVNLHFPGTGKVGALMRVHDWSSSVLGDPSGWPVSLRSTVRLTLNSKFPMFVAWGPALGFLYNDAYAEILGNKHPLALGARFQDIWQEIWPDISPIIDSALQGHSSYYEDLPLVVERAGLPENAWFTFSYSRCMMMKVSSPECFVRLLRPPGPSGQSCANSSSTWPTSSIP